MSMYRKVRLLCLCAILCTLLFEVTPQLHARVTLPGIFSDNMVLQRGMRVPIWGWAAVGEEVTVRFQGQRVTTTALNGQWQVNLARLRAGQGPAVLEVIGSNTLRFTNVLVGEVWICSGQSNMEFPLKRADHAQADIAAAAQPLIRLFTVRKHRAEEPTNNVLAAQWQVCTPETVVDFSAVGYYFGRDLQLARQVPVGLIHTSWGGSPAEVWMSHQSLAVNPDYRRDILDAFPAQLKKHQQALAQWEQEKADLEKMGKKITRGRPGLWEPSELFNGMIAPLIPFAFKGVIWYQGESNAGRAWQYRTLFPDLIKDWRRAWGEGDFTFLAVQLAPFGKIRDQPGESTWAELREAQNLAAIVLPKVGVVVITDVGDEKDIHPTRKAPVGARLALAARAIAYGEAVEFSGPTLHSQRTKQGKIILSFDHVGHGLEARGGPLKGFAICGVDGRFFWAHAEMQGNQVVVSSLEVPHPIAVRYGWADCPVVNLWSKDGLPASPFRTDEFPLTRAQR